MSSISRLFGAILLPGSILCCVSPRDTELSGPIAPSDFAFHSAMEAAFSQRMEGRTAAWSGCRPVRNLQCTPIDHAQRSLCSYGYQRRREGTAVLERERHGFWRWISGPKNCSANEGDEVVDGF